MKKNILYVASLALGLMAMASCSDDKGGDDPGNNPPVTGGGGALNCVEQIIDGCLDIANEVGEAKIGDPLALYNSGQTTEALYAVESWYSWHSREDYYARRTGGVQQST